MFFLSILVLMVHVRFLPARNFACKSTAFWAHMQIKVRISALLLVFGSQMSVIRLSHCTLAP